MSGRAITPFDNRLCSEESSGHLELDVNQPVSAPLLRDAQVIVGA